MSGETGRGDDGMPPDQGDILSGGAEDVNKMRAAGGQVLGGETEDSKIPPDDDLDEISEKDRYLPVHNITRIMKDTLPHNAKIAKESKEAVKECVSEFISFVTSEASDTCKQNDSKTMSAEDLLWAMSTLGFERYVEPLKQYIDKYHRSKDDNERVATTEQ